MKLSLFLLLLLFSLAGKAQPHAACKVALVQTEFVWGDVAANLASLTSKVQACKDVDIIVLPELFASGCDMRKKTPESALQSKEETAAYYLSVLERMKTWAAATQALIIGSTVYKEGDKFYNRLLAVFPDGNYQYYDKHNCFRRESFSAGDKKLILEWKGHRLATFICYDLRFAEWSDNADSAYDTAVYIANWPDSRREDWNNLLRERAIENKVHVIAVNCVGTDLSGLTYAGDSYLLSPAGDRIGGCTPYRDEISIVELPWQTLQ